MIRRVQSLVLCTLVAACGGSIASPIGTNDSGTGNDGGSGNDSGVGLDGGGSGACPPQLPTNGSACSREGLACEYGSSHISYCNVIATCSGGQWTIPPPPPGPFPECSAKNPPACPATFASVPVGTSCSKLYPTHCNYPEGECACTVDLGGPFPEDASALAKWFCSKPQNPSCPNPRPKIGSACNVSPSVDCNYGACVLPGGTVLHCESGIWQETPWACPD